MAANAITKTSAMSSKNRFGKNLAALRIKRGLTQESLAERVGVSARYLQSLESGEYFPSLLTLAKLKTTLKGSWDDLLAGCDKS